MDFSIETRIVNNTSVHYVKWISYPINKYVYAKISKWVYNSHDYAPMNSKKLRSMEALLKSLNKKYGADVQLDQAISIRNIVLKDKIIKNYSRMNSMISKIYAEYMSGVGILKLSATYDFPPLNLLRGILIKKGLNQSKLYDIFANRKDPESLLSGRDLQQYHIADRNDAESTFNQQLIATIAAENENTIVRYFSALGIKLVTQEQLVAEQVAEIGRAVLTPDILFLDEVYINGARTHWIDYKDYVGTNVQFLYESNKNQAAKYNAKWGPGALCYHKSFVDGLIIPAAMLLDARSVPVKLRNYCFP